jgi:cytochrome d ubiquinol oxidase subunit I
MDDVFLLSRMQFALTIMFHYIFPPLSIGLGTIMVIMEGTYLWTGDVVYHNMTKFWSRVFAVNFALGVATGLVMEFQFGTNWAAYSRYVGDVFGSALAAEGIFAFFLESGFLAVLVFGWDHVSPRMHFFATVMVALGSLFSAVWIVIANSWMHTPAGFEIIDGRAVIIDFWAMIFNPSSMNRLIHVVLGAYIQGAFFVMSIAAYYLLMGRHLEFAKRSFTIALVFGAVCCVLIGASGHSQGQAVAKNQPAKLAAMEGHFETGPAALNLVGVPDPKEGKVNYGIGIPGGLSFLVHGDFNKPLVGLNDFPEEDRPPVVVPFVTYHLMVGIGSFLMGLSLLGLYLLWRGTLFEQRWLLWVFVVAVVGPIICNQAGWVAAEVGRQPFIVYPKQTVEWEGGKAKVSKDYEGLRTDKGLSNREVVTPGQVLASILMFGFVYLLLFVVWVYVLNDKIQHGPDEYPTEPHADSAEGLLDAAAANKPAGGSSLTQAGHEAQGAEDN